MVRNYFAALTTAMLLAGCTTAPPHQVNQLHNQVSKLNKEMGQLTRQASALEQQNSLNVNSSQGAWLIPGAKTPVVLQSQMGDLNLSLTAPEADDGSSKIRLHIQAKDASRLQPFSARIEWGERDSASGKPLPGSNQNQQIHVDGGLTASQSITVTLQLNGIQPEQLGYVRVHDIVPDSGQ
ncbi:hypothetical protein BTJ39_18870 [Izhakiella australiensis]|uniref:DUF3251 domain-containing protein n=2 Tax=Izhakiella australiensis TaxID=1926881 RepID=A0A1S8YGK1_9GAMM|nr:hypothetical protein BTJ39_18870 [Izhakiella australiensis]